MVESDEYYLDQDELIDDYIADEAKFDDQEEPDDYDSDDNHNKNTNYNNDTSKVLHETSLTAADGQERFSSSPVPKDILITRDGQINVDDISTGETSTNKDSFPSRLLSVSKKNSEELYGFERYTGISAWRNNGSTSQSEKGYDTFTMEAATWKKRQNHDDIHVRESEEERSSGKLSLEGDNLDTRFKRHRLSTTTTVEKAKGLQFGAEAPQLVRYYQRLGKEMLGRSWGKRSYDHYVDDRFIYRGSSEIKSMPQLSQDSVLMTVSDGFTVNVELLNGKSSNTKANDDMRRKMSNCQKDSWLGLPIKEIVRKADIIQKRAIKRNCYRATASDTKMNDYSADEAVTQAVTREESSTRDTEYQTTKDVNRTTQDRKLSKIQTNQDKRDIQLQHSLWVDKHAPTSISQLLSDERTNREVLRTLRLWDPYVFKRDPPARPVAVYSNSWKYDGVNMHQQQRNQNLQNGKQKLDQGKGYSNKVVNINEKMGKKDFVKMTENQKIDIRPEESSRVILLSGPPGVGKSTLAHIVCRHAGYRPIEVNASDERSASALTERVMRAMESSTLILSDTEKGVGKAGKPNCIILDEIDGVDAKSSITALIEIIRADIPPSVKASTSKKKNGGSKTSYLRRPIILICNDKHAPTLRPILSYARQFNVQPPTPERLTGRLRAILAAENMSVVSGSTLLHRLVAATGGDARSCIHALQFASARARELDLKKRGGLTGSGLNGGGDKAFIVDISKTLTATLGEKCNGMKDIQGDILSTVTCVFRKEKLFTPMKPKEIANRTFTSQPKGVDSVLKAVDLFGDNSKTLDCLFMNINRVSYVDPTLDRCSAAFEWISGADIYRSHKSISAMNNSAEYQSMQKFYIPSAAAAIHVLCCVETRPDLTFSTRPLADMHYQNQANVSLIRRFLDGLNPRSRCAVGGGTDVAVSDVIPYGLWLLSAGDGKKSLSKPVSAVEILSPAEKIAFSSHVATLRALGVTYVKEDVALNTYKSNDLMTDNVRLEPEIDKLVKFDYLEDGYSLGRKQVPPLLKELLAHAAKVAYLKERENDEKSKQETKVETALREKKNSEETGQHPQQPTCNASEKESKRNSSNSQLAKCFLRVGAVKAKEAKTARRAAMVSFDRSKKVRLS